MAARFQEISATDFTATMRAIGFSPIDLPNTYEWVFERFFTNERRFSIRVFSSVSTYSGFTRDSGTDAIRVMIHDHTLNVDAPISTVKRTKNALTTLVVRCREAWAYKDGHKCTCGAIMVERNSRRGEFLGCSAYPVTKCGETREIDAA